jgi:MerR family transcriptional regulator, light-induced transcriptional regulator
MKELMTPKQVALALGVSEASLKRLCDKGLIPAIRTAGGHRRLPINAVINFIRQTGRRLMRPEVLGLPPSPGQSPEAQEEARALLLASLEDGQEEMCRRVVMNLFLEGRSMHDACDHVIAPVFRKLGERWRRGEVEVYQERRSVEICARILHEFRLMLPPPVEGAPLAIGATLEGDCYSLATSMVEVTLIEAGWAARSYGCGHPVDTLVAAIEEVRPRLFWLSVSVIDSVPVFVEQCRRLYDAALGCGSALVVGGRALGPQIRSEIAYSAFCDTLGHLAGFAATLWPTARS